MRMNTTTKSVLGLFCALCFCGSAMSQSVSFNSPGQWITQRNDNVVAKVQLDTSKIPQKKIDFVLSKVEAGKKKAIATKSFKVTDYTQEFNLGSASSACLGGKDFLRIDWSIPGTKDKGTLMPFGIVNLDKMPKGEQLHIAKIKDEVTDKNFATVAATAKLVNVKGTQFGLVWGPKALTIVVAKGASKDAVKFAIDGKNGKNAFLSHPDRTVELFQANDSLATVLAERASINDTLNYAIVGWQNEIKKYSDSKFVVIVVPWFDLGLIANDDRIFGFAAFVADDKNKVLAASPEKAQYFIPGTWGDAILDK